MAPSSSLLWCRCHSWQWSCAARRRSVGWCRSVKAWGWCRHWEASRWAAPEPAGGRGRTAREPHTTVNPASSSSNTVEVMIIGADYRGLLLQGREYGGDVAVGNWAKLPKNTKVISCFNIENSAITHSNAELKSGNTVYTWNPPRKNKCGLRVEFVATVAQSRAVYWTGLKSDEISMNCRNSVGTLSGFATVVISPLVWLTAFWSMANTEQL